MKFKQWLQVTEMASFSVPPQQKLSIPCGMIKVPGINLPCQERPIGALDMRFEGPPPYDPPFNSFNNGSKFIAKIPASRDYLVYHGPFPPAEVMREEKALQLGYPKVPDYWYIRAEIFDTDYNLIKPALGDVTGERQQALYGK